MCNSSPFHRSLSPVAGWSCAGPAPAATVQTIDIACPPARALDFMSDAQQWIPWAMPELQAVQPLPFGQWLLTAPTGLRKLRLRPDALAGALTLELVDPVAGTWPIPVYLRPTPTGCQLVVTLRQPAHVSAEAFETCLRNTLNGLSMLRLVLEQD